MKFKDVVVNIKPGETYISKEPIYILDEIIADKNGYIKFNFSEPLEHELYISSSQEFELKRTKVSFEEAFKAYEEGKEIESVFSGNKYKKENLSNFRYCKVKGMYGWHVINSIYIEEIKGAWYINEI